MTRGHTSKSADPAPGEAVPLSGGLIPMGIGVRERGIAEKVRGIVGKVRGIDSRERGIRRGDRGIGSGERGTSFRPGRARGRTTQHRPSHPFLRRTLAQLGVAARELAWPERGCRQPPCSGEQTRPGPLF